MPVAAAAPDPDDHSRIIRGCTRAELAKKLGMHENTIKRIEIKFRVKLAIALQKDPATRHLAPRDIKDILENL
jgi:transcriptional regulator with XRE-family HTH domain